MKKDIAVNELIACNDVFADIVNANILWDGQHIIPEDLKDIPADTSFKDLDGTLRRLFRDVIKEVRELDIGIAFIGMESQARINNIMPLRDMGYAYTLYVRQVRQIVAQNRQEDKNAYAKVLWDDQKLKPVLTFILYFGDEEWDTPLSLWDMLDIPEHQRTICQKYVPEHRIHVITMKNQPEYIRKRYQSDYRIIADALAYQGRGQKKLRHYLQGDKRILIHAEQTLDLLDALCGSSYVKAVREHYIQDRGEKEAVCMADIFQDIFEDMREQLNEEFKDVREDIHQQQENIHQQQENIQQQQENFQQRQKDIQQQWDDIQQQQEDFQQQREDIQQQREQMLCERRALDERVHHFEEKSAKLIQNLLRIWDIPTVSQNTGFSVEEIKKVAAQ